MPGGSSTDGAAHHGVIVVGASAGGVEALKALTGGLPAGLPAAVLVVVHVAPHERGVLPDLLTRAGPLPAAHAEDGEPLLPGRVYVAPPDRHLLVERRGGTLTSGGAGSVRLSAGPRENHSRPAADPLFRSAALAYGDRVVGVVLSGALSDGTAGLWEVKQRGGVAVVQDPGEAAYPSMPHSAMDQVPVDHVVPAAQMGALLARLVGGWGRAQEGALQGAGEPRRSGGGPRAVAIDQRRDGKTGPDEVERDTAGRDVVGRVAGQRDRTVALYVCPDCGGTLWQASTGPFTRFRCHVGHAYGGEDLLEGYTDDMERSMWRVVRSLRDVADLTRQLAVAARARGDGDRAASYEERARLDEEHSDAVERMIGAATKVNRGLPPGTGR